MLELEASLEELDKVSDAILQSKNHIFLLSGNLAAGKTTLVQNIAKKLGVSHGVNSPTFSLMQSFEGRLFHYDLYNHDFQKFLELGILDELEKEGLHFIEWGEGACEATLKNLEIPFTKVTILPKGEKRIYRIEDA